MNWIYLYKIDAIPMEAGDKKEKIYVRAKTAPEALSKARRVIPGNYKLERAEKIAELYDFGADVYVPEMGLFYE